LKNIAKKNPSVLKPVQAGQIWEVADVSLRIYMVGKTLVHYKRYKGKGRGVPTSFSSKRELEKYLTEHKAVLVHE
jgi:hypothetical protein